MIATSIVLIFVLSGILLAFTKPKWLVFVMIFFAGWHSLFIDVGLAATIYRLIVIIFLLCLPLYLSLRKDAIKIPPSVKYLLVFACYAIVIAVTMRFFTPESPIAGFTRGEGRWIFQIVMLLIDITPAFLPLLFFKKIEDVKTAGKVFIVSTAVLCAIGWMQSLAFYLYGVTLFPVFRKGLTGAATQVMVVPMLEMTFHRMHSLGGEPKDFAITVAVAIVLLIIFRTISLKKFRFGNLLIGFLLISLLISLATSGFLVLAMGLALIVILSLFIKDLRFKFAFKPIVVVVIAMIIFFGIMVGSEILPYDTLKAAIIERTIARLPIELFDAAALGFLFTNPQYGLFGVGMGNIHLYAWDNLLQHAVINPLLAAWVIPHAHNFVFIPNSGYLEIISELGIIGLFLFLAVFLIPIRFNLKYRRYISDKNIKDIGLVLSLFCFFILVVYLMRAHQINYAFITLGLLYFFNREIIRNFKPNANIRKLR